MKLWCNCPKNLIMIACLLTLSLLYKNIILRDHPIKKRTAMLILILICLSAIFEN